MKKNRQILHLLLTIAFIFIINSCSEDDIVNAVKELSCDLITTPTVLLSEYEVTYSATKTGTASITNLVYFDADGNAQTIDSPELPWSLTVTIPAGKTAQITAVGVAINGSLEVKYSGSNNSGSISSSDKCANN